MSQRHRVAMIRANLTHIAMAMAMANSTPKLGSKTLDYCSVLVFKVNKQPIYRDIF